jgi:hypothetical protein
MRRDGLRLGNIGSDWRTSCGTSGQHIIGGAVCEESRTRKIIAEGDAESVFDETTD